MLQYLQWCQIQSVYGVYKMYFQVLELTTLTNVIIYDKQGLSNNTVVSEQQPDIATL